MSVMEVIDFLFSRLVEQINIIRKLRAERDLFLAGIDELNEIIVDMSQSYDAEKEAKIEEANICDFEAVCSSTNYITHYTAHHGVPNGRD